eukprot:6198342-Pleurochrysis_carterae.AAC.3
MQVKTYLCNSEPNKRVQLGQCHVQPGISHLKKGLLRRLEKIVHAQRLSQPQLPLIVKLTSTPHTTDYSLLSCASAKLHESADRINAALQT